MPRMGKTDISETKYLHAVGLLSEEGSCRLHDGRLVLMGDDWNKQKMRVWGRDKGRCKYCRSFDGIDVHHIIKKSDGGGDELTNLVLLCRRCHTREHPEKSLRFNEVRNAGNQS